MLGRVLLPHPTGHLPPTDLQPLAPPADLESATAAVDPELGPWTSTGEVSGTDANEEQCAAHGRPVQANGKSGA